MVFFEMAQLRRNNFAIVVAGRFIERTYHLRLTQSNACLLQNCSFEKDTKIADLIFKLPHQQDFGSLDCPSLPGTFPPHPPVTDVAAVAGRNRGIQGHQNSCYLDATLFSMFAFTSVFDSLLYRPRMSKDIVKVSLPLALCIHVLYLCRNVNKVKPASQCLSNLHVLSDRARETDGLKRKVYQYPPPRPSWSPGYLIFCRRPTSTARSMEPSFTFNYTIITMQIPGFRVSFYSLAISLCNGAYSIM